MVTSMGHVPESGTTADLLRWIAYERDAAWTAKLAILRARRIEDVTHFGACLREHDRHADELAKLVRVSRPAVEIPMEPTFVTKEPFVVGAIDNGRALVEAMEGLERVRVDRYDQRHRGGAQPATLVDGLLDRHQADACARLASLMRLRETRRDVAA
jgi:hypothetical protein